MSPWVYAACDLCGETEGKDVLTLSHSDAPGGAAFIRRCGRCGLRRLWPRPADRIVSRYYPPNYNAFIARRRSPLKQGLWDLLRDGAAGAPGRGRLLRPLRPLFRSLAELQFDCNVSLDREPLPRILDVGCGFGDLLLYWKSRGVTAVGVDVDERAVSKARQLGLEVLHGDLMDLRLTSEAFDVAVLNHSLEHMPHPLATLREVARLLCPGGEIHITVPNGASDGLAIQRDAWEGLHFPLHFWFFDSGTLSQALHQTGFHHISLHPNRFGPRLPQMALRPLWRMLSPRKRHEFQDDLICAVAKLK